MTKDERAAVARLKAENRKMYAALAKITDLYVSAPGWANPTPTTKLVWSMYQTALKARANVVQR